MDAQQQAGYSEAPASWNVRYRTADGFECQLTLRGSSGADLLPRTEAAVRWLVDHGCSPTNGQRPPQAEAQDPPAAGAPGQQAEGWCAEHGVQMQRRERNGQTWWSHKAPDGSWCRGTAGR